MAELASRAADVVRLLADPAWLAKIESSHRELRGHGTILGCKLEGLERAMFRAHEIIAEALK